LQGGEKKMQIRSHNTRQFVETLKVNKNVDVKELSSNKITTQYGTTEQLF